MASQTRRRFTHAALLLAAAAAVFGLYRVPATAQDLEDIRRAGVIRHLGIPYANFVTGSGDGLDVEMMQRFAEYLGVRYEFVGTAWGDAIADLTGERTEAGAEVTAATRQTTIRGDVIASGFTRLAWRERLIAFSRPVFPTQIWLVTRWDCPLKPITPTGDEARDILQVKSLLAGRRVMGKADTCLDPKLYGFEEFGARIEYIDGKLIELPPAVLEGRAESILMEVPDILMALEKWPGKIKVIGPVSPPQHMAYAMRKSAPRLLQELNRFLERCRTDGTYLRLVKRYYPALMTYYPDFFSQWSPNP